jgi:hypothetical protein
MRYWPPRSETLARRLSPARPSLLSWVLSLSLFGKASFVVSQIFFLLIFPFHIVCARELGGFVVRRLWHHLQPERGEEKASGGGGQIDAGACFMQAWRM